VFFAGGTVLTGDPRRPRVDAVAVAGGRVVALGAEARDRVGVGVEVVDLAGRSLVPGFRDGHLHPLWGGTALLDAPIVDAVDVADVLERVRGFAEAHPGLPWITGAGYPPEILPGGIGLASVLDSAVADRPVALWASDHHTMWVNSAALAAAGIDARTSDPPRGIIARAGDGTPVGTLLEDATALVERHLPVRSRAELGRGLTLALARMAAAGIVAGQEAALEPENLAVYLDLAVAGRLTADVSIALRVDPARWQAQRPEFLAVREAAERAAAELGDAPTGRVRVPNVKFFADGVIEMGTGALLEPYSDDPSSRGIPNWSSEELAEAAAAFDADGFSSHIHALGDAGVRMALDAVAHTRRRNGAADRRPVVAHTQLVHPDDLRRFAALGAVANFEPLWAQRNEIMTELTEPRLGPERSNRQYPIAEIVRSGALVSFGSDWPVSSMVPLEGIAVALTRQTPDGHPPAGWLPQQRVALDTALSAYTRGVATQLFDDDRGTITVGAPADLALLGADISRLPGAELAAVAVEGTWLGGTAVHRG